MTLDLTHLRPGVIAAVTLDDGTVIPPAEVRDERGVGLYVGPILVRLPNGHRAPGVEDVRVEDDDDPEVEALARAITDAFCKNEWTEMTPESRRNYRIAAGNLIADGWRRDQPETIEVVKDCFDDFTDTELDFLADEPTTLPLNRILSFVSRRAQSARKARRERGAKW